MPTVRFDVTDEEKKMLDKYAMVEGLTLQEYIRSKLGISRSVTVSDLLEVISKKKPGFEFTINDILTELGVELERGPKGTLSRKMKEVIVKEGLNIELTSKKKGRVEVFRVGDSRGLFMTKKLKTH